ncbi:transglutaminaseTgpA domain-containing protein [Neisseriaceae bacterium B1]
MNLTLPNPSYLDSTPDFKAMLFTLVALVAVSVPLLMQLPIGVVAVFALFWLVRLVLLYLGVRSLKLWQLLPLAAMVVGLVFQQLGTIFGLDGGIAFLLLLATLKSYEGNTRRDWQVLVLAMLFLLTGAVLFEEGLFTALWVFLCLMMMAMSLALLNNVGWKMAIKQSFIGFLLTLLPMMLLFITMPRRASPLWGVPQQKSQQATTGISDTMKPGSIGDLVLSNEPAFSATFDDGHRPQQRQLYWRMMIMGEHYNGAWHTRKEFGDSAQPALSRRRVAYQVIMQDDKGRIPALDYPYLSQRRGFYREMGDVVRVYSREGVRRIKLESSLSDQLPHKLNNSEKNYYTKLPEGNLRTQALAKILFEQSNGNTEAFIQSAYNYFTREKFVYTLKAPVLGERNSTDQFLFGSKQGFCEHYADAFVVMMRAVGLPARVVTGYQGGEYNEQGGFWQIRSKDAHAWAEVWLPEKQVWQRVDPTAAVAAVRIDSGLDAALPESEAGELAAQRMFWQGWADQGRFYWQQWVVNYDDTRQQNLFARLGFGKVNPASILIILLLGSLPALLPIWLWWCRSRKQDIEPMAYGFMLLKRRLLGTDYADLASVSPLQLRDKLESEGRWNAELNQLIQDYIQLNYAQSAAPSDKQARAWYRQARNLARKYALREKH